MKRDLDASSGSVTQMQKLLSDSHGFPEGLLYVASHSADALRHTGHAWPMLACPSQRTLLLTLASCL